MKICHITTTLGNGGAEGAMFRLIQGSSSNEHVVVSLGQGGKHEPLLKELGVKVIILDMKKGVSALTGPFTLFKILKNMKPDVVQTWMYHSNFLGGLIAKLAGVQVIHWGIRMTNLKNGGISLPTRLINRVCASLGEYVPNRIVSCANKATIEHINYGYPEHKFITIPNGYDTEYLSYSKLGRELFRAEFGIAKEVFLCGTVARWHPQKDHETLFKALKNLLGSNVADWMCVLVGPDMLSTNEALTQAIDQHGLTSHVVLAGQKSNMPEVMSAIDLHVLTSRDEGFPNVLAEAMACGSPCVTTDVGDAALIVGKTGWITEPGDYLAISSSIQLAMLEHKDNNSWGKRKDLSMSRIHSEFGIQNMVRQFENVWNPTRDKE